MTEQASTTTFVSAGARVFLRRRMEELMGLLLLALAAGYLVALLTAKEQDPSFDVATDNGAINWAGTAGAFVSGPMLTSIGLACFMLALAPAVWGLQLIRHRPARWWLRLILLPLAIVAASIGLSLVPGDFGWPFQNGLGGFAGHLLTDGGGRWPGLAGWSGVPDWAMQMACLVLALPLFYFALGVSWRRYHQAGQGLAAASEDVSRRAGSIFSLFRRKRPEAAAEYRAERYEQDRPRRMEPRLGENLLDEPDDESAAYAGPTLGGVTRGPRDEDEPLVEPQKARPKPGKRATKAGQATLDLVRDVGFDQSFNFIYSRRPGTPAASLPDEVAYEVKLERLERLQAQLDLQERTISRSMVGSVQRVLVDAPAKKNAQELTGRTANNRWVNFAGPAALLHRFTDVLITDALRHTLRGRLTPTADA